MMLQHDVMTTSCLIFYQSSTSIIPIQTKQPTQSTQQASISHHYRCKISTESRKVLYIKNPQHYFFKATDPISDNNI